MIKSPKTLNAVRVCVTLDINALGVINDGMPITFQVVVVVKCQKQHIICAMAIPKPASEIWSGFWRAVGAALATSVIGLIATHITPLKQWVAGWYGNHATSGKTSVTIFLCVSSMVLLAWVISWKYRKRMRTNHPQDVPDQSDEELDQKTFDVLKFFALACNNPNAMMNVQIVANQCQMDELQARECVKTLWNKGFIFTTVPLAGEWNSHYRITDNGRQYVRYNAR